jgi:hypothetical protein
MYQTPPIFNRSIVSPTWTIDSGTSTSRCRRHKFANAFDKSKDFTGLTPPIGRRGEKALRDASMESRTKSSLSSRRRGRTLPAVAAPSPSSCIPPPFPNRLPRDLMPLQSFLSRFRPIHEIPPNPPFNATMSECYFTRRANSLFNLP